MDAHEERVDIVQLIGPASSRLSTLGEIQPKPVDDSADPKKRILLAGLLVGAFFVMAKLKK